MTHPPATKSLRILQRGEHLLYLAVTSVAALLVQSGVAQPNGPTLTGAGSNDSVTVTWPLSAYYFILETKTDSSPSVPWQNLSTASKILSSLPTPTLHSGRAMLTTNIVGDEISVTVPVTNAQQFFRLEAAPLIPIFQFAVFYNDLMEFTTCASMTINGPVHANGPIYTGSSSPLTFNDVVTTSSDISSPANNGASPPWAYTGAYNANPPFITNMPALTLPIGTNNPHALIEIPPAGEDPSSELGQQRFFNRAQVVLLVSNLTVTARIQSPPSVYQLPGEDPSPILLTATWTNGSSPAAIQACISTNFPFLMLTSTFLDQREDKTNVVTLIDVGKYAQWIATNASVLTKYPAVVSLYPTILFVADCRTNTANELSIVRLANGIAPPRNGGFGWSLATPNPLYVLGNYNCTNAAYLGTTNTFATVPCAFMSDALTILSDNWNDAKSFIISSTGTKAASATTVNAGILTGIVPSTSASSSGFSGGVHNLPRLLENWTGCNLWLNTSIINLYNSTKATGQFVTPGSGSYYVPPTRHFNFNQNFVPPLGLPPGTPIVSASWPAN